MKALGKLSLAEQSAHVAQQKLKSQFDEATKDIPPRGGLTTYGSATKTTAFTEFTTEWNETLQLLRGLCKYFHKLGKRPAWVDASADPTVHFDQFLHACYYVRARNARDDDENVRTVGLVNRAHERNKVDTISALEEAATWWASLPEAPYGEDLFIRETAPRIRAMFSLASLASWQLKDFQEAFFEVHAFKMHARQMRNTTLGLPSNHHETVKERSTRVVQWLWEQSREESQMHIRDLVQFLIWGAAPTNMAERLWLATTDHQRRYAHFGSSTLGEAVGGLAPTSTRRGITEPTRRSSRSTTTFASSQTDTQAARSVHHSRESDGHPLRRHRRARGGCQQTLEREAMPGGCSSPTTVDGRTAMVATAIVSQLEAVTMIS